MREICSGCNRPLSICICDALPPKPFDTKNLFFYILQHPEESKKKKITGSVSILPFLLSNYCIQITKSFKMPLDFQYSDYKHFLLFPASEEISCSYKESNIHITKDSTNEKVLIFVLDATWTTAKRMLKKSPYFQTLPRFQIHPERPSIYHVLRKEPNSDCYSTLEACLFVIIQQEAYEGDKEKFINEFLKPFRKMIQYQIENRNTNLKTQ